jgi:hypothetical protein
MGESTRKREAYFLDYAQAIREVCDCPLMVTGGFRTRAFMEEAVANGETDMIGLGRPLCTDPDTPKDLLEGRIDKTVCYEDYVKLAQRGFFSPASPLMPFKIINVLGGQAWYYQQIFRLADGEKADPDLGILKAVGAFVKDELSRSRRVKKARPSSR